MIAMEECMAIVPRPALLRAEDCAHIEIADAVREGDDYSRGWRNDRDGWAATVSVRLDKAIAVAQIEYVLTEQGGNPEGVRFKTGIDHTDQHFGGVRLWWLCPNIECQRRCRTLYAWGRILPLCRGCLRLRYRSQDMRPWQRIQRRADAITRQMGVGPYALEDWPPKPAGMHWSTYEALMDEWAELRRRERDTQYADMAALAAQLQRKARSV